MNTIRSLKIDFHKLWLIIYMFTMVFQPPFFSISLIYITGALTFLLLVFQHKETIKYNILKSSHMLVYFKIIIILMIYLVLISVIDGLFLTNGELFTNRLRCLNQLIILTPIQLLAIYYILFFSQKYHYGFNDIFEVLAIVGLLQGLCSITAYLVPSMRAYFLSNMGEVFTSTWTLQRRGYGFSSVLLDTFGYGMGLIAGYCLLLPSKRKLIKIITIALVLFSILMNARTGLIVFFIAVALRFVKSNSIGKAILKFIIFLLIMWFVFLKFIPIIIGWGRYQDSFTIKWIVQPLQEIYEIALGNRDASINSVSFLSHDVGFPTDPFELIFGSGHSIYGTASILGFSSDIGYYNIVWIYGLIGSIVLFGTIIYLFIRSVNLSNDVNIKYICIFNILAYFVVLLKANLLGYNPGTFVTYLTMFVILYFEKNKISHDTSY